MIEKGRDDTKYLSIKKYLLKKKNKPLKKKYQEIS